MEKDNYIFPAILTYEEDGITIIFPDLLGCITCANCEEEIFKNAEEALFLHLKGMEQDKEVIPGPNKIDKNRLKNNQKVILININYKSY